MIANLADETLDRAIELFHTRHPAVEIHVNVVAWDVVRHSLLRNTSDIGIDPTYQKNPRLNYEPLFLEYHRPYCGHQHPLWR